MAYQGETILLPLGEFGLTGSQALSKVPPQALLVASNISFDQDTIRKEGGASKLNASAIGGGVRILGGWDWWPTIGAQRTIVYTSNGAIYKDSGGGTFSTTLMSGLSGTGVGVFCEAGAEALALNRKLFFCNGMDVVKVISGDAGITTDLLRPPSDWAGPQQPICLAHHDGRLWGALGHRVYYSTADDHEDFQDTDNAGTIAVGAGSGERIVQIMSYKGLLLVWKYPTGVYYVDTTDPQVANWGVRRLSNSIGGVSPQGAVQVSDDVLFIDQVGNFQLLSGIQEYGSVGLKNLSQLNFFAPFFRENTNRAQLPNVRGIFYPEKLEAHFAVAQDGQSSNNARVVVDFNRTGSARFRWSPRDTCESLWLSKDTVTNILQPMAGDDAGFVWKLDRATFEKDGVGYLGEFQTPHLDFGWLGPEWATRRKNGGFLEIVCDPTGQWILSVDVYWDDVLTANLDFNVVPTGAVLGSFVLDTDTLGAPSSVSVRKRLPGSGKRLSLHFYNSDIDADFNIAQAYVSCTLGDERNV